MSGWDHRDVGFAILGFVLVMAGLLLWQYVL